MSHVSLPIIVIGKIGVQILVAASRSYTFNRYATLFCCYKNWVISRLFCQVSEIICEHSGNIKIHYEGYSPLKLLISSHFFTICELHEVRNRVCHLVNSVLFGT